MRRSLTLVFTESPLSRIKIQPKAIYVSEHLRLTIFHSVLHILYMKSSEKALSRNYNA